MGCRVRVVVQCQDFLEEAGRATFLLPKEQSSKGTACGTAEKSTG